MKKISIAIDGPAGAGKSSVAKLVANRLHYLYIDTGAMYRAFTWAVQDRQISIEDEKAVQNLVRTVAIRLVSAPGGCQVFVDDREVTEEIRSTAVSSFVSPVSALAVVREKLVQLQREMSARGGIILDGRDIGTVVLPDAELKIYLTASVEARAKRRWLENTAKGDTASLAAIAENIASRDTMDSQRAISPLRQAEDAIRIDNSDIGLEETAELIVSLAGDRMR